MPVKCGWIRGMAAGDGGAVYRGTTVLAHTLTSCSIRPLMWCQKYPETKYIV